MIYAAIPVLDGL